MDGMNMDFKQVLPALLEALKQKRIRYAALGGFALGVLKVPRTTQDLDFLVHRDDLPLLDEVMHRLGYRLAGRTENASRYIHGDSAWGAVDALHAFRTFSLAMLERAQSHPVFDGTVSVNVLQSEDVIGFKVQAMANNPMRVTQDLGDIETLMAYYGHRLDWARIQEYFDLFEMGQEGRRLREQFDHAE